MNPLVRMTAADELEAALRLFFRVAVARPRKRTRPHPVEPSESPEDAVETHLRRVKQVIRDAKQPDEQAALVQRALAVITSQLGARKVHPLVLDRAVALSDALFRRSAALRKLVAAQTSQFYARLLSAAGEDGDAHGTAAKRTRSPSRSPQLSKVLALIEQWKESFGARYPPLVTAYDVLVTRGYEFPRARETRAVEQQRALQTQAHRGRVRELKVRQRQREMAQMVPEMETLLSEMHQVFEILIPTLDAFQLPETQASPATDSGAVDAAPPSSAMAALDVPTAGDDGDADDDIEWESVDPEPGVLDDSDDGIESDGMPREDMDMNEIVAAYGLGSASYQLTIEIPTSVCERSAENEVLFRSLADGILRLRKRFLPLVRDWLAHTIGPDQAETRERDEGEVQVWRQLQDLHARLHDVELKWEDLVRESERKRFARLVPAVVTVPTEVYEPQLPDGPHKRRV